MMHESYGPEPQVNVGGGGQTPGAASLLIRVLPDNPNRQLADYQKLFEDQVQPRLARIPGVSQVNLQGEQLNELIVGWSNDRPIYLSEVADVEIVPCKQDGFTLRNGYPAYYITVQREYDAGDRVAVRGAENLREGAEVKIIVSQSDSMAATGGG